MTKHWRFALTVLLLTGAALLLAARRKSEIVPARVPLAQFPRQLHGWDSVDRKLDKDQLDKLGPGDFMVRDYSNSAQTQLVNLYIAYFPSQTAGDSIHSPKNCLPGSGWVPLQSDKIEVDVPGHAPFPANRYIVGQGDQRMLVLYWFWAHDRGVASEYSAKFYLVADSIRMHRTDGSLVRLYTPMAQGESVESAQSLLLSFASDIVPLMNTYVPR